MSKNEKLKNHIKKLKLTPEEYVNDINAIFKVLNSLDKDDPEDIDIDKFEKDANIIIEKYSKKYPKNLGTEE
jgi:hypothetical protein